ncbi:MAG: DUF2808 domain-containing protein [Cyanobacteria bacterium P01_H01_bin.58]
MLSITWPLQQSGKILRQTTRALLVLALATPIVELQAAQLGDGTTVFDSPPRLVNFVTTRNRTNTTRATYYITVNLLPEAGESLQTLTVSLTEGRFNRLRYRLNEIVVFQGDRQNRGALIPVKSAEYVEDTQTLTIHLAEAARPGQLVTFGIKPVRNPNRDGIYLFNVMAAPAGDQPVFQRVGTGRIHIYRPDGRDPFDH